MTTNRREFLAQVSALAGAALITPARILTSAETPGAARKRIAFLGTEVRTHSHAQHFLEGFQQVDVGKVGAPRADGFERPDRHALW